MFVSQRANAVSKIPPQAIAALRTLGEHLSIARLRRKESQRVWAKRLAVSIPTLIRMEQGDPAVGMGPCSVARISCQTSAIQLSEL